MSDQPAVPSSPADGPDSGADGAPVFAPYNPPAGGWGALRATARALREQSVELKGSRALLSMNQPEGFDCPGCAWPDPRHTSSFEFCENGAKAVTWELTKRRVTREFFAAHTVRQLEQESDYWLEEQGRLTEPMRYDPATDHYVPVGWDEAFALVGRELNALDDPNEAEFYTSGRTSNEAAFMYQLFARRFGTNNFPDCSNMCHEPTSVGLPESIGIGKGTVLLDDFAYAEAIFILGQNPGTNSPRMLTELHRASRRKVPIVVFNPLRERALERFAAPQDPVEMATFGETRIASEYCQVRNGGDVAALKGVMKLVLEAHDEALRNGKEPVLDLDFIAQPYTRLRGVRRRSPPDKMGRHIARLRSAARPAGARGGRLHAGGRRHRRLRHGDHPTSARHCKRAADREFVAAARQFRQARSGDLPGTRPFERARRPHDGRRREAEAGIPRSAQESVRLRAAACSRAPRRQRRTGNGGRARQGVYRARRQFRQSGAGLDRGRGGDAPLAADRRRQHQAQPRPSGSWRSRR